MYDSVIITHPQITLTSERPMTRRTFMHILQPMQRHMCGQLFLCLALLRTPFAIMLWALPTKIQIKTNISVCESKQERKHIIYHTSLEISRNRYTFVTGFRWVLLFRSRPFFFFLRAWAFFTIHNLQSINQAFKQSDRVHTGIQGLSKEPETKA